MAWLHRAGALHARQRRGGEVGKALLNRGGLFSGRVLREAGAGGGRWITSGASEADGAWPANRPQIAPAGTDKRATGAVRVAACVSRAPSSTISAIGFLMPSRTWASRASRISPGLSGSMRSAPKPFAIGQNRPCWAVCQSLSLRLRRVFRSLCYRLLISATTPSSNISPTGSPKT